MTTLNIYAAGSLRLAFPALAELFKQSFSTEIHIKFGPAGLLCEKLLQKTADDNIHLFASANTLHPKTLIDHGKAISDYGLPIIAYVSPSEMNQNGHQAISLNYYYILKHVLACLLRKKIPLEIILFSYLIT